MSVPKALSTVDWNHPHWSFLISKPQAWKRVQTINEKIQSVIRSEWCFILNIELNTLLSIYFSRLTILILKKNCL